MYIKLTRLDNFNTPIWINAAFVVTVEPRKGGGSVVVPIGDGLDYDVRESPEQVLAMLADAPAPAVVPVPAPKSLTPMPEDVSPEPEQRALPSQTAEPAPAEEPKPAKRTRKTKKATDGEAAPKRTRKTKKAADEAASAEAPPAEVAPAEAPAPVEPPSDVKPAEPEPPKPAEKPPVSFSDEQVERLKRMAPRSMLKLQNTLKAQFRVADAEAVVEALKARGVIALEQHHVVWK